MLAMQQLNKLKLFMIKHGDVMKDIGSFVELEFAKGKDVYIAGGYGVYKEAIPLVDVMYITEININVEQGDVFFPEFDDNNFNISIVETSENNEQFIRKIYRRKNKQ